MNTNQCLEEDGNIEWSSNSRAIKTELPSWRSIVFIHGTSVCLCVSLGAEKEMHANTNAAREDDD